MTREVCSSSTLQTICLQSLKRCDGFENVNEILIQPRECLEGGTNWSVAAVRPRVDNSTLRGARQTIEMLQSSYELPDDEVLSKPIRRRA